MGTWAIGDLHGCKDEFFEMVNKIEKLDKNPTFILVGDIEDRGPKSKELMDWALENITTDGKFQMVLGNHEKNIINFYESVMMVYYDRHALTQDDVIDGYFGNRYELEKELVGITFREFERYIKFFKSLPLHKEVVIGDKKYVVAHAWYDPKLPPRLLVEFRDVTKFDRIEYNPKHGEILIHGHTPTVCEESILNGAEPGKIWDKGTSINIDCGLAYKLAYPYSYMAQKGNLAAYRMDDGMVVYLYE